MLRPEFFLLLASANSLGYPSSSVLAAATIAGSRVSSTLAGSIAPRGDHHQHLLSHAGAEFLHDPPRPELQIPDDILKLLQARAGQWNNQDALAKLFVPNSLAFSDIGPTWIRGSAAVAEFLSKRFAKPYHLTPTAFSTDGSSAHVAGYFSRSTGSSTHHFGHFYIEAERLGGSWRISVERSTFPGPGAEEPVSGQDLLKALDAAGIGRAAVLSDAYWFDAGNGPADYDKVRAENDWTAIEAAKAKGRLVAFCSFNPLRTHALPELARCASKGLRGVKLHFQSSAVDLLNPEHLRKVKSVFRAANRLGMPIIVHARGGDSYGEAHARVLLSELVTAAPDTLIQVAHLWGGGAFSKGALEVYASAVGARLPQLKNVYFDISDAASVSDEDLPLVAQSIRTIGLDRIFYGSDALGGHAGPREAWSTVRKRLPLSDAEFARIALNVAPYLR